MSFDRLAPHYQWMEFVLAGEKLQRCRTAFLEQVSAPENILIWGEGNGRFLIECRRKWKDARILCADASERMLALANERIERFGLDANGIEFLRADVLKWSPMNKSFDLVVTHFFLDCFRAEQLQQIVDRIAFAARPNASWLLADFQMAPVGLQRLRAKLILTVMYLFFRIVTRLPARRLTSPDPYLISNEFFLRERRVSEWGLLRSDLWRREIR
jgi:ubiquinone/menaquinone biosynthesis C-methylase UbiE